MICGFPSFSILTAGSRWCRPIFIRLLLAPFIASLASHNKSPSINKLYTIIYYPLHIIYYISKCQTTYLSVAGGTPTQIKTLGFTRVDNLNNLNSERAACYINCCYCIVTVVHCNSICACHLAPHPSTL